MLKKLCPFRMVGVSQVTPALDADGVEERCELWQTALSKDKDSGRHGCSLRIGTLAAITEAAKK
jgi:hypothetical protein